MKQKIIGVISDTHGELNPKIGDLFQGVDLIIHAGDIGSEKVLTELEKITSVVAVQGNMDCNPPFCSFPENEFITVMGRNIYILHNLHQLDLIPSKADISLVISGHNHCPKAFWEKNVLFLNPGSARLPRHFGAPSVAIIKVSQTEISYKFVEI